MFKIPEDMKNKYEFVTLAAKRAEQLQGGALPRIDSLSTKLTVVAQQEVAAGVVPVYDPNAVPIGQETAEEE